MSLAADRLAAGLRGGSGPVLVVTGAGISLASGIPTFRGSDPDAIWHRDLTELATFAYFREHPVESWAWYLERFSSLLEARPNPAHQALVALEQWAERTGRPWLLVTQNIDTLHEQAGSHELIKVHGSSDRVRCSQAGCRLGAPRGSLRFGPEDLATFQGAPSLETLPRCPECEAPLRPHVLWFDEYYGDHADYQWQRVVDSSLRARTVLFVGTSFSVGVTDLVLQQAMGTGAWIGSIDPAVTRSPHPRLECFGEPAEELLPAAVERLA